LKIKRGEAKEKPILKSYKSLTPFLTPFSFAIYCSALGKQGLNLRGIPIVGGFFFGVVTFE
jgi:hypothetical protein